jgi:hypothetical protein
MRCVALGGADPMNTFTMLNRAQRVLVAAVAVVLAAAFAISANAAMSATGHDGSSDRAATKEWKTKNVVTAATKEWKTGKTVVVATKEWKTTVTVK